MFLFSLLAVRDCNDVKKINSHPQNGVFTLKPFQDVTKNLEVFCQFDSSGNGWTVSCFNLFKPTTT